MLAPALEVLPLAGVLFVVDDAAAAPVPPVRCNSALPPEESGATPELPVGKPPAVAPDAAVEELGAALEPNDDPAELLPAAEPLPLALELADCIVPASACAMVGAPAGCGRMGGG